MVLQLGKKNPTQVKDSIEEQSLLELLVQCQTWKLPCKLH